MPAFGIYVPVIVCAIGMSNVVSQISTTCLLIASHTWCQQRLGRVVLPTIRFTQSTG